jgi:hypothetical protein
VKQPPIERQEQAHQEEEVVQQEVMLQDGATRGNTTTRQHAERWCRIKRLQRNKKPHNNKPGKYKVAVHLEVLKHQEGERRHNYR